MSIIRTYKKANPYLQIEKTCLEDSRLSFRAKGLHTYLMSKPDGWQVHINHLAKQGPEGKHAIRMALLELEEHGYIYREYQRDAKGRLLGYITDVYETPDKHPDKTRIQRLKLRPKSKNRISVQPPSSAGLQVDTPSPKSDLPKSEKPKSENPPLIINDSSNNGELINTRCDQTYPQPRDTCGRHGCHHEPCPHNWNYCAEHAECVDCQARELGD